MSMKLSVVSIRKHSSYDVEWIECTTAQGNRIIQPGHEPTMLQLKRGTDCIFQPMGATVERMSVKDALLYVTRTDATLLIDE